MDTKEYQNFVSLMSEIDLEERQQRDRGTLFELLVKVYLIREPMYSHLFDKVWTLSEVPEEYNIPKKDTGVDLVARRKDNGSLVAIQCKYYAEEKRIEKKDIDSFLNEIGKNYYSEGIVVTSTDKWTNNANDALSGRNKPIVRVGLTQLRESKIDWSEFSFSNPNKIKLHTTKIPRPHQYEALEAVMNNFESNDRGKLIMAPGTGKTYTSMIISEKLSESKEDTYRVLYLVPSIQLLSQSLHGWTRDTKYSMDTIAVCSDKKVTKTSGESELEDIAVADIGYPATTNFEKLLDYKNQIESTGNKPDMLVVFSTYQSIEVISEAQKNGFYEFDLIISDEAHRTTGATKEGTKQSPFVKVHDNKNIKARKRLYQTATPRVYGDAALQKAEEMSVVVADMNDKEIYGEEIYRLGFGEAVHRGILTDYKVMVLAVDEAMVQTQFQQMFSEKTNELEFNDVSKIIGCWNGLLKRKSESNDLFGEPMKRAIAFTGTIKQSKQIRDQFNEVVNTYLDHNEDAIEAFKVEVDHADGSMNALEKNKKIDWLKSDVPKRTCRILSNARFLTEGVDVPDLDAVMFLQPRRSTIDIAQAVGRVMRKTSSKEYGYVILPIGVPGGKSANEVLDKNEKYQVVWEVLNALRSIDERFDAMVNKIELNKKKPNLIDIIGVGDSPEVDESDKEYVVDEKAEQIELDLDEEELSNLENAIYGKIVQKVGNTRYWETWSKDVSELAQQYITRINAMIESEQEIAKIFNEFLVGLHHNINSSITQTQAVEMIAQHAITKPVFDALFEEESFALNNPVSQTMNKIIQRLELLGFNKEQEKLEGFYESVRIRARGIDNLEAKQKIIVQLYEKFFKIGFPKTTESLGIVFTPIEVVDFIIQSIDDILGKDFKKSLSDKNINVLDPFTGTGTFITRLLQSGLISKEDLLRKYTQEIFANEIVLLSYYIAAINIEETFKEVYNTETYESFEGIVLTDTFESTEHESTLDDDLFKENNKRLDKQQERPITVIMGNPPYSARQTSDNDDNKNNVYLKLDQRIRDTFAKDSPVTNKNTLYDSMYRALMWSSERLGEKGVIGFITNNSYIDSQTAAGVRKYFYNKFNDIYIIDLKGSLRAKTGEMLKKEGGNIFNILTGVAIIILVKNDNKESKVHYYDIGENLSAEEKLIKLSELRTIKQVSFEEVVPDENNDWINLRDNRFDKFIPMDSDGGLFYERSLGVSTNRDSWVYGFNKSRVINSVNTMVNNFNFEINKLESVSSIKDKLKLLNQEKDYISWSGGLKNSFKKGNKITTDRNELRIASYRPYTKKWLYYDSNIIERKRKYHKKFGNNNEVIIVPGNGSRRPFSTIMVNEVPDLNIMDAGGQGFFKYDNEVGNQANLFVDKSNMNEDILKYIGLDKDDTFVYIYALFHSNEYRDRYANNLNKSLPRIPISKNKDKFVTIGRKLRELHLNYENVDPYNGVKVNINKNPSYEVKKMKFAKGKDKTKIIYNKDITIENIPQKAYEYIVNGRSAIEWVMDQYQYKVDSKSGIVDDPNKYSESPMYILNLLNSIISVSIQTVELVNKLPKLDVDTLLHQKNISE